MIAQDEDEMKECLLDIFSRFEGRLSSATIGNIFIRMGTTKLLNEVSDSLQAVPVVLEQVNLGIHAYYLAQKICEAREGNGDE